MNRANTWNNNNNKKITKFMRQGWGQYLRTRLS